MAKRLFRCSFPESRFSYKSGTLAHEICKNSVLSSFFRRVYILLAKTRKKVLT